MSTKKEIEGLVQLTELVFSDRSAEVHKLAAREQELRTRFEWLTNQRREALSPSQDMLEQRLTGLDVLYQVWIGRQQSEINTELAQILAEKELRMRELRDAFGKKDVALQLLERVQAIKRPDAPGL